MEGVTIRTKIESSPAPSARAASMISLGNILKFCRMKKMMKTDMIEGRTMAAWLFSILKKAKSLNCGMTRAIPGMIRVRRRMPKTRSRAFDLYFSKP